MSRYEDRIKMPMMFLMARGLTTLLMVHIIITIQILVFQRELSLSSSSSSVHVHVHVDGFGFTPPHARRHNISFTRKMAHIQTFGLRAAIDELEDDSVHGNDNEASATITPSQLESLLQNSRPYSSSSSGSNGNSNISSATDTNKDTGSRVRPATEEEVEAAEKLSGNVAVPKTGISINDEMTSIQSKEHFVSTLFPLSINMLTDTTTQEDNENHNNNNSNDNISNDNNVDRASTTVVAAIQTVTTESIGDEQMRYIVALDQYDNSQHQNTQRHHYAMIDVPPFSNDLVQQIQQFMNPPNKDNANDKDDGDDTDGIQRGILSTILITCRDGIHYDESPAVYVTRKSDLQKWKHAFPDVQIVMYRLDTPRDCKDMITQSLDGYGPWGLETHHTMEDTDKNLTFVETGRPLTRMEWDEDIQIKVLDNGEVPPDDDDDNYDDETSSNNTDENAKYTPQAIKEREQNKNILAVYTPGHTFGSVSFIFPKINVLCAGYTIPIEDTRSRANSAGLSGAGPALDYRGYISTNSAGIKRQVESARELVNTYGDRFTVLLPSRGPPVTLSHLSLIERQRILHEMLDEFAELGQVYESMGII